MTKEEEKAWREKRFTELKRQYADKFQDPVGKTLKLSLTSGGAIEGTVTAVGDDVVEVQKGGATIKLKRADLAFSAKAACYEKDFVDYMARRQLADEVRKRGVQQ